MADGGTRASPLWLLGEQELPLCRRAAAERGASAPGDQQGPKNMHPYERGEGLVSPGDRHMYCPLHTPEHQRK